MELAGRPFREHHTRAQDGRRLYYRDYGDPLARKAPLLCLCGLTRNSKDFHRLASRLAAERRVVCPDYRGRGRSEYDSDWRNYRARVILGDVRDLMIAANLHRAVVCGVSFGGLLAMALSVVAPTALAGAILNDVGPNLNADGTARILGYIGRDHPQPNWDAAVATMKQTFPTLSYSTDEEWRRFTEATFREGGDGQLHVDYDTALAEPLARGDSHDDLWRLFGGLRRLPVLVVRGGVSDVLGEATMRKMAEVKPDLAHLTLPGVGHVPSLSEPDSERAIDDLLSRVDG
jgi:pimeloyl-ACP methyl ester carboxylesterase